MSTYQGWANYETWCVALWIDNEEASQLYWREATTGAIAAAKKAPSPFTGETSAETTIRQATWYLAERLKDEITDVENLRLKGSLSGLHHDLLQAAFDRVDWHEIAKTWIDEELS